MDAITVSVNSSGLTTSTPAYTGGDVLGSQLSFANAVASSGGFGEVVSATLVDDNNVLGTTDLFLFSASTTPASNNAANSWSDADMENLVGVVNFPAMVTSANNRWCHVPNVGILYNCSATTLYGVLVTRTNNAVFGNVADITVKLGLRRY